MSKIRTRNVIKGTIKVFDKSAIVTEKVKNNIVNIKEKSENVYKNYKNDNTNQFAENKILNSSRAIVNGTTNSIKYTKRNIKNAQSKIKKLKTIKNNFLKNGKQKIKIKNPIIENTQKTKMNTIKNNKKAIMITKWATERSTNKIRKASKATISSVKAIIASAKSLISVLIASGVVVIIIIIIICLIGLLLSSIFGIFFSGEKTSPNAITMKSVIEEINQEIDDKIDSIKLENEFDDFKVEFKNIEWKNVLSIYVAKVNEGENKDEVLTLNDEKVEILKDTFWDMYELSSEIKTETIDEEEQSILYIKIDGKTIEEMMDKYNFNSIQREQVKELLSEEYEDLWNSVLFGISIGDSDIVSVALSQVGNVGGEIYWKWYGFNSRVEWCAIFVSWVADQAGYIESKVIPKFSGCQNGIDWFKKRGQWKEKGYIPKAGDIIFFDWEVDGKVNHVGIVEKVENDKVYTIEGNSDNDTCRQKNYSVNSKYIYGYGVPLY